MPRLRSPLALAFLAVTFLACDSTDADPTPTPGSQTIVEVAQGNAAFSTLVEAVVAADLAGTLSGDGPFTVFAPTNAAFAALPDGTLESLLQPANRAQLQALLTYHVVPGRLAAADLTDGRVLETVQGEQLVVGRAGGAVTVNGVAVQTPDVAASNGLIHGVGGVLMMPDDIATLAQNTAALSTLVTALQAAGLVSTLQGDGPFTVFAPTNAAFEALQDDLLAALLGDTDQLTELLTYHVVPGELFASELSDGQTLTTVQGDQLTVTIEGGAVFVDGARVTMPDVNAGNGVVHVVDGVLAAPIDLVDAAGLLGFTALAGALEAAGLVDALRADGPFTVFAPTNQAFAQAAGTVPPDQLEGILLYHVVSGRALSSDLSDGQTLTTLQGGTVTVRLGGGVTIDGANSDAAVAVPDVVVGNGVIHAIDAVLLP